MSDTNQRDAGFTYLEVLVGMPWIDGEKRNDEMEATRHREQQW